MESKMKEGGGVFGIPSHSQAMATVSPGAAFFSPGMAVQTPSPFSVASTRWSSSRPSIHIAGLVLRSMLLVFSFAASLALAAMMPNNDSKSFQEHPELIYSIVVTTLTFIYSAFQLFKGIFDIACRGILISDKTSDYISFILDQLACYFLVSCSSVTALTINRQLKEDMSLRKEATVSVCMSVAAFLVIAVCGLLSGYKLSKRIM